MKNHEIMGVHYEPIDIIGSMGVWHIAAGATVIANRGIDEFFGNDDNQILIDGQIVADIVGLFLGGENTEVSLSKTASVSGGVNGLYFGHSGAFLTNAGTITGNSVGVDTALDNTRILNSGLITGEIGISAFGSISIINQVGGRIAGSRAGILGSGGDGPLTLINHGTIIAGPDGVAVFGGADEDNIVNDGRMIGTVDLLSGDDRLDLRNGSLRGLLFGNEGDDTLITDNAKYFLSENADQGVDTVRSTVSYKLSENVEQLTLLGRRDINGTGHSDDNTLTGNAGNNILKGLDGSDDLLGNRGNDKLLGGGGEDTFHFRSGDGHDVIIDYVHAFDRIELIDWDEIRNFHDLIRNHSHEENGNVIFEAGNDSLTLLHAQISDLEQGDFIFAS